MTGRQAVIVILGLGLLGGAAYGSSVYLEARKEVQMEELRASERIRAIEALEFASHDQVEQAKAIRSAMEQTNEISQRALTMAERSQEALLKAASRTNETIIGDSHLSRDEAKTLTSSSRKRSSKKIVEQEMRVVDVNTSDPLHTSVIIEDPVNDRQFKVTFRDAIIEEDQKEKVFDALKRRERVWLRLSAKFVDDEVQSYEIIKVIDAPEE